LHAELKDANIIAVALTHTKIDCFTVTEIKETLKLLVKTYQNTLKISFVVYKYLSDTYIQSDFESCADILT
jgi:uncharacterized Fe-S cluster-containing protein